MPLSDHEQRLFEEIEQSLSEDPQFASAVRASDPAHVTRRRLILAGVITVIGIGVVVGTVIAGAATWGAPIGAVLMFGGLVLGLWAQRRAGSSTNGGKLKAVDGKASRDIGSRSSSKQPKPGGFTSRMEERWRRRRDNGGMF